MRFLRCLLLLLLVAFLAGCQSASTANTGPVLVLVAASTTDAVQEIAADFTRSTGIEVKLNADASSKLATQIIQGAPADLFLSADEKWARAVADQGLAAQTHNLLGNALVLIVPKGNRAGVQKPQDLLKPKVKHVALAGPAVPAGIYARQALRQLHLLDVLEQQKKIVSGENVRVTLTYVETDEADAGIVYATDARISTKVQTVHTFAASTHEPIVYPLVLLQRGAAQEAGRRFYDYLRSAVATTIFQKYGFTRP